MIATAITAGRVRSSTQTVAPADRPVGVEKLKARVRYTDNDYDDTFSDLIDTAVEYCQEYQWAQYCTATYVDTFDRFTNPLELLRGPVQSVVSVQYVDTGGTLQTLTVTTDYTVDTLIRPCRIVPAYAKWWPASRCYIGDVTVTYIAGYGAASAVPAEIKNAILLKAAQLYEPGGNITDALINCLLDKRSFRVMY